MDLAETAVVLSGVYLISLCCREIHKHAAKEFLTISLLGLATFTLCISISQFCGEVV